jgi:hypothetical protein
MTALKTMFLRPAVALAALALCVLAGCTTPLERAWGVSQHAHAAQSIANPDAGLHDREARRTDGRSTEAALTKYRTKEAETVQPEPPPVINIQTR